MSMEGRSWASELDSAFRQLPYAANLKANPRWSRYTPEGVSNEEWRRVLHADGDGLDQTRLMIRMTDLFLRADTENTAELNDEDVTHLYLATAMQNWGKSETGEDVTYERIKKTDIEARKRHLHTLMNELTPDLSVKVRFLIETTVYDRNTKLGRVFDAIRRINCLRTGLMAYDRYVDAPEVYEHKNLGALSLGMLSNQLPYLITYAEQFAPVNDVLEMNRQAIDNIFADRSVRDHPMVAEQQTVEAIEMAETIWSRSHGQRSRSIERGPRQETIFSPSSTFEKRFIDDKQELLRTVESLRALGMRITLTSGSFDLLHVGHARYLERASEFGDILVVGVDSDTKIQARKGPSRPVVGEAERLRLLSHIRGVDLLTLKQPDEEKWGLIKLLRPDTLVVTAETYQPDEIRELEASYCRRVVVLEPQATTSTGAQIRRIEIGERQQLSEAIAGILEEPGHSKELRKALGDVAHRLMTER